MTIHLAEYQAHITRVLERSGSFQGRIGNRCQVQIPLHFPQHQVWVETFRQWWRQGFASWRRRAAPDEDRIFLCELGPRDYAITDAQGEELSNRWDEALLLKHRAREAWQSAERSDVPGETSSTLS